MNGLDASCDADVYMSVWWLRRGGGAPCAAGNDGEGSFPFVERPRLFVLPRRDRRWMNVW
jgi:hypothetical protein